MPWNHRQIVYFIHQPGREKEGPSEVLPFRVGFDEEQGPTVTAGSTDTLTYSKSTRRNIDKHAIVMQLMGMRKRSFGQQSCKG